MKANILSYILLFIPCTIFAQGIATDSTSTAISTIQNISKAAGDSAYIKGDYPVAISIYENLLENDKESAEIYYNLANAYYKSDNIAKAILNYERALLLQPADDDIRFNLTLAKSKTVDKVSEEYNIFFMQWLYDIADMYDMKSWALLGIMAFVIMLVALLFFLFNNRITFRKGGFAIVMIMLFITIFANLSALRHYRRLTNRTDAIILTPSVTAKSTPDDSGTNLFIIHEGRKVKISDDTMRAWKEIELEDGTMGWIPTETVERI